MFGFSFNIQSVLEVLYIKDLLAWHSFANSYTCSAYYVTCGILQLSLVSGQ